MQVSVGPIPAIGSKLLDVNGLQLQPIRFLFCIVVLSSGSSHRCRRSLSKVLSKHLSNSSRHLRRNDLRAAPFCSARSIPRNRGELVERETSKAWFMSALVFPHSRAIRTVMQVAGTCTAIGGFIVESHRFVSHL